MLKYSNYLPAYIANSQLKDPLLKNVTLTHCLPQKASHDSAAANSKKNGPCFQSEMGHLYLVSFKNVKFHNGDVDELQTAGATRASHTPKKCRDDELYFIIGGHESLGGSSDSGGAPRIAKICLDTIYGKIQFVESSWFSNPYLEFKSKKKKESFQVALNDREALLKMKKQLEVLLYEMKMERKHRQKRKMLRRQGSTVQLSEGTPSRKRSRRMISGGGKTPNGSSPSVQNSEASNEEDDTSREGIITPPSTPTESEDPFNDSRSTQSDSQPHCRRKRKDLTPIHTLQKKRRHSVHQISVSPLSDAEPTPKIPSQLTQYQSSASSPEGNAEEDGDHDDTTSALPIYASSPLPPGVKDRESKRLKSEIDALQSRLAQQQKKMQQEKDELQQNLIITQTKLKKANKQISDLEARNYDHEIERLRDTIRLKTEELSSHQKTIEEKNDRLKMMKASEKKMQNRIHEISEEHAALQKAYKTQSDSMGHTEWQEKLKKQEKESEEKTNHLQTQLKQALEQCSVWKEKHDTLEANLNSLKTEHQKTQEGKSSLQTSLQSMEEQNTLLEKQLKEAKSKLETLASTNTHLQEEISREKSLHSDTQDKLSAASSTLGSTESENERLRNEINSLKDANKQSLSKLKLDSDEQHSQMERQISQLNDNIQQLQNELDQVKETAKQQSAQLIQEEDLRNEANHSLQQLRQTLEQKEISLTQLTSRLDALQKKLSQSRMDHTKLQQQYQEACDRLSDQENKLKQVTHTSDIRIQQLKDDLTACKKQSQREANALQEKITSLEKTVKQKEIAIEQTNAGNLHIASRLRRQAQMAQKECTSLEKRVSELEKQLEQQQKENQSLNSLAASNNDSLGEYRKRIDQLSEICQQLEEELSGALNELEEQKSTSDALLSKLQLQHTQLMEQHKNLHDTHEKFVADSKQQEASLENKLETVTRQHQEEKDELKNKIRSMRTEHIELLNRLETEVEEYRQSLMEEKRKHLREHKQEKEQKEMLLTTSRQLEVISQRNKQLTEENGTLTEELFKTKHTLQEVRQELDKNSHGKHGAPPEQVELLREELAECRRNASFMQTELKAEQRKVAFLQEQAIIVKKNHEEKICKLEAQVADLKRSGGGVSSGLQI